MPLQVEFVSMLAQAQKMVATTAVNQYMGFIANYAQVWPELADAPDIDDIADSYAEYLGLEAKNTTSREDREAKRQARAQAQQAREQAEAMNQAIGAAKTLGDTQMNGGESSALDELMSGAGGRRGAI